MLKFKNNIYILIAIILLPLGAQAGCSVSADSMSFGNYQPFDDHDLQATSTIYMQCDSNKNTTLIVSLSRGNSASYNNRQLNFNSNSINYNIFTSNGYNKIWGDGSGSSYTQSKKVKKKQKTLKVYGLIPKSQSIPPGIYTDSIIAEISY